MQTLAAHGAPHRRVWPWILTAAVAVLAVAAIAVAVYAARTMHSATDGGRASGVGAATTTAPDPFKVTATTPAAGATSVATDTTVTVHFSLPLTSHWLPPTLSPAVSGHWVRQDADTLVFHPDAPFVPESDEVLTVPAATGSSEGMHLAAADTVKFTVATGSTLRLEQLLAELGYLPLSYVAPQPVAPQDMATTEPGTLTWRWNGLPAQLTALWTQGDWSAITKAAVMTFESQNGLTVDGLAGPMVWGTLLAAAIAHKGDTTPWNFVLVTKTLPQHVTVWSNGAPVLSGIPANTGAPGAATASGTFEVFEHVKASTMKGTNITGSTYDDPTVPWASYFNGGDALHGFPRARYGFPQSNGCVEMPITTAGKVWPYSPIGTVVIVTGTTPG